MTCAILSSALSLHRQGHRLTVCDASDPKIPRYKAWGKKVWTEETLTRAIQNANDPKIGIVLGLSVIDIEGDDESSEAHFLELFDGCEVPTTWTYRSRRSIHRLFKVNSQLAALGKATLEFKKVEIRTGAGGKQAHSLVPPSETDGVTREWINSPDDCELAELPDVVVDRILLAAGPSETVTGGAGAGRPGDDFNAKASWPDVLEPHGWTVEGNDGDTTYWKRPGKRDDGHSASTGYCGDLFYVFSTNATPFVGGKAYNKFAAYAFLNHDGDFSVAADQLAELGYGSKPAGKSIADKLINLALEVCELSHYDGVSYATFTVAGHRETHKVHSVALKRHLIDRFYHTHGKSPNDSAIQQTRALLDSQAFTQPETPVHLRVAPTDGAIYYDLGNEAWRAVKVTRDGWTVVDNPPVKFRRTRSTRAWPEPVNGGTLEELLEFTNVRDASEFRLLQGWMLGAMAPDWPRPILIFNGPAGSAKSSQLRLMRQMVDPAKPMARPKPKDPQNLAIMANNSQLLAFDNLSDIPEWFADGICRIATGDGYGARKLYEDDEEVLFEYKRPVLLNGIEDLATREDVRDRSIIVNLERIDDTARLTEAEIDARFAEAHPRILGALFTAVAIALRKVDEVELAAVPRMADFARWAVAGIGEPFLSAYSDNQLAANDVAMQEPLPAAVAAIAREHGLWQGSFSDLHRLLPTMEYEGWPKNPRALSAKLKRHVHTLGLAGVRVDLSTPKVVRLITQNYANVSQTDANCGFALST